jgi:hypothetical protein
MTNNRELIVKCWDNCSCLSIDYWDEPEDNEYILTFYNSYSDKTSFGKKLKDIWKIIRGKRIYNSELILTKEDFDKIRNFQ